MKPAPLRADHSGTIAHPHVARLQGRADCDPARVLLPANESRVACFRQDGKANTLVNGTRPGSQNGLVDPNYIVRRLTPTECARLQGFPDDWCAAELIALMKRISDSGRKSGKRIAESWAKARRPRPGGAHQWSAAIRIRTPREYKMWGNGVALPCVCFVLSGSKTCSSRKTHDLTCYSGALE